MTTLTPAQDRAIRLLVETMRTKGLDTYQYRFAPREVALLLWPDSPAWNKRTRFGAVSNQGALGGTMPMNAAKLLWRLHSHHLVMEDDYRWSLTSSAVAYVDEHAASGPVRA